MSILLIKNAAYFQGETLCTGDILIHENGLIEKIEQDLQADCQTIDATGRVVLPSFVDMHTHLRTPGQTHKEDLVSGCTAAVKGGYTVLNAMANTTPVCSGPEQANAIYQEAKELGLCDVYQSISLTKDFDGKTTEHLDALAVPCDAVRCVSEDGRGVADGRVFLEGVRKANQYGKLVLIHAEDAAFSDSDMYAAEDLETLRDVYLLRKNGLRAHFCHVSTASSAKAVERLERGFLNTTDITMEVTPHHLALNDDVEFKVNPPLRSERDRAYMVDAALNGEVAVIATDHAPHTLEDKQLGAPGLVGLETAFSVCYTVLCREQSLEDDLYENLPKLVEMMCQNPRELLGLPEVRIEAGFLAELVIVDLEARVTIDADTFASKGRNTPFDGMRYYGEVLATIKEGRVVYAADNL